MEDILRRLGNVEKSVGDLRSQVDVIAGALPYLATAAAVSELESRLTSRIDGVVAVIPHLATAAAVSELDGKIDRVAGELRGRIDSVVAVMPHLATTAALHELKVDLIKWMISTALAISGTVFTIAKFVH